MGPQGATTAAAPELKRFLGCSAGLHLLVFLAALNFFPTLQTKTNPIYTIDFVGPSATIISKSQSLTVKSGAVTTAPGKPPPQTQFDEFVRRRRKTISLPRPSLLLGFSQKTQPRPSATSPLINSPASKAAGAPADAGIATDMPNFPYPWYISQVRAGLWNQWSTQKPQEKGECVAVFSLLRNGKVVDLRIEVSSGDSVFDLAALSAVQDGSPYPPLPRGYTESFLKIHVTLKSQ